MTDTSHHQHDSEALDRIVDEAVREMTAVDRLEAQSRARLLARLGSADTVRDAAPGWTVRRAAPGATDRRRRQRRPPRRYVGPSQRNRRLPRRRQSVASPLWTFTRRPRKR